VKKIINNLLNNYFYFFVILFLSKDLKYKINENTTENEFKIGQLKK
jgi:hypothetical protein